MGLKGHNIHLFVVTSSVTALRIKLIQCIYVVGIVAIGCAPSNLLDQCNNRHKTQIYQKFSSMSQNPEIATILPRQGMRTARSPNH